MNAVNSIIICTTISVVGLIVAGIIILVSCLIYDYQSRTASNRFHAAADAYTHAFGADKTIDLLNRVDRCGMDLDDISRVMERAVKSGKEIVCS